MSDVLYEDDPDVRLMLNFKKGDEDSFGLLVAKHSKGLINYFYRQGMDREQSEDACHEVFIKLYEYRNKYLPSAKFTTFLYRMAHNHWVDYRRSRKNKPDWFSLSEIFKDSSGESGELPLPAKTQTPLESLTRKEVYSVIENALETLSTEHREVFVLSEIQGLKYNEIAEVLDIPVGTVKSRMFTCIQKLRTVLSQTKDLNF